MGGEYLSADQVFLLRPACRLQPAAPGTSRQIALENRAGLSTTQGRTRTGSLRGSQLERVASPCDAGHAGPQLSDVGNAAQQKKLLAGPCRGRVAKFSGCFAPGPARAATVANRHGLHSYLTK